MSQSCSDDVAGCTSVKFSTTQGMSSHKPNHTTTIAIVSLGMFLLIITMMTWNYRKHPALQSKINAMRYRNGGISPSSDHDNSDDPVSTPSHLPMKAKRITMTISEIDIAAPSLSTIQRGPTPLSPPTHLITKPAPVVIAKSQLPNPHDNPILPPSTLEDQLCPICIHPIHSSDSARQIATCGHIFHAACLIRWLSSYHANCPLCKVELKAFELSPV